MSKRVVITGFDGRTHALGWKIKQSPEKPEIFFLPGNAGTVDIGENVSIRDDDIEKIADFAEEKKVDLTIIGPEKALQLGIVDLFRSRGMKIFGPSKAVFGATEGSKIAAKRFMAANGIPTASFRVFRSFESAQGHLKKHFEKKTEPSVIKADGLALGRGVKIARTCEEAEGKLREIFEKRKDPHVLVERYLPGEEVSIHALTNGISVDLWPSSQDYKTLNGEMTGGVGAIAPVPWVTEKMMASIRQRIVRKSINMLRQSHGSFVGCLYPGLMWTSQGPNVLEYNFRFGNPEILVYMRLMKSDPLLLLEAHVDQKKRGLQSQWFPGFACCVVLAAGGYPGNIEDAGMPIEGIEEAEKIPEVVVFHGATVRDGEGTLRVHHGRVLYVTARGDTLTEARERVYQAVACIHFEGMQYRDDIGLITETLR